MSIVDSSLIVSAVEKLNRQIKYRNDALSFLYAIKKEKDPTERLISWLIVLKIIKPDVQTIPSDVANLYTDYFDLQKKFFHGENPLKVINDDEEFIISADTQRSNAWFSNMSNQIGLLDEDIKDAHIHIPRVLATLTKTDTFYSYTQGYDRYAFITYALGLLFTRQVKLPAEVAESFSYALCKKILRLVDINHILGDMDNTQEEFRNIDKDIEKTFPEIYKELQRMNHGSFYFALKWELILFADEHTLNDTFLIWDSIFVRLANYDTYKADLILAHLSQIQIDQDSIMVEKIQKYKEWDTVKLVEYAVKRYDRGANPFYQGSTRIIFYVFILLFAAIYFYLNRNSIAFQDL